MLCRLRRQGDVDVGSARPLEGQVRQPQRLGSKHFISGRCELGLDWGAMNSAGVWRRKRCKWSVISSGVGRLLILLPSGLVRVMWPIHSMTSWMGPLPLLSGLWRSSFLR